MSLNPQETRVWPVSALAPDLVKWVSLYLSRCWFIVCWGCSGFRDELMHRNHPRSFPGLTLSNVLKGFSRVYLIISAGLAGRGEGGRWSWICRHQKGNETSHCINKQWIHLNLSLETQRQQSKLGSETKLRPLLHETSLRHGEGVLHWLLDHKLYPTH